MLKMLRHTGGYYRVMFWRDGRAQQVLAHKVVLEAFVGPRPEGHQACHGNGDRKDNRLSNLRWGTAKENQADREAHGTRYGRAPGRRLSAAQVARIRAMAANDNISQVAHQLGLARTTVADVVNRRTHNKKG
jgi:hypothetical protein